MAYYYPPVPPAMGSTESSSNLPLWGLLGFSVLLFFALPAFAEYAKSKNWDKRR